MIVTERLQLFPPGQRDFHDWSSLRERSRDHLEPWEPRWAEDANSKADWSRRLRAWRKGWRDRRSYVFLVRRLSDSALVGGAALSNVRPWPALYANLGYWLGAGFEGHGYMCEAVQAVCGWAFDAAGLERIEAGTLPENQRSQKVLFSCGFREEGLARDYLEIAGKRQDHILFGLVRSDLRV